jgi:hypothetical protein
VFGWEVQSVINEGRLKFMYHKKTEGHVIDKKPFHVRVSNFENKKLLIHPSQAKSTRCKEVVTSCFSYGRNKKARKVWIPKASQNFKSKDEVHASLIRTHHSSKPSKFVTKRKNMVWIPKVGQTIKPKDNVQTSSIATTCHTSMACKGIGKKGNDVGT